MIYTRNKMRRGLSLVEVVVSSMLVGSVVVGSLTMLGASVRTRTVANDLVTGPLLAEQMLAEIMSMPYEDPEEPGAAMGNDSGESPGQREQYDDVDDYNGWFRNTPRLRDGTQLSEYLGWTRAVGVWWVDRATGNVWISDTGLKRFTVTVTSPDGVVTERRGMRGKWGSLEQELTVDTTVVTRIEAALTIGPSTPESRMATQLLNHVEDPNGS